MSAIERRAFAHEDLFDLNAYDYPLPEERIAQTPAERNGRTSSVP